MSRPKGTGPRQTQVFQFLRGHQDATVDQIMSGTGLTEVQVKHVLDKSLALNSLTYSPLRGPNGKRTPVIDRHWRIVEAPAGSVNGTAGRGAKLSSDLQAAIQRLKFQRDILNRIIRELEGKRPEIQTESEEETL